jgi:D-3-phosphoglycerate dehydrogenase / 2-oxoglutarate reductase
MQARDRVVLVDRPSWYEPEIERQELARASVDVVVGWANILEPPPQASAGYPAGAVSRERLSAITSAYIAPSVTTEERVIRMAEGAAGILAVRATINARVMDALPTVRVIGRYGIGVDNIDVDAATERGIAVVNAPGFCAREVADHTLMFILASSRKLGFLDRSIRRGRWPRDEASPMRALFSQTLGLIGFGQIGREVAHRAAACGMTILALDPYVTSAGADGLGVKMVNLQELLLAADFISVHAPLTNRTRHVVGKAELRQMKRTAYLINTSRGPLVDEAALLEALDAGWIAGAALDVFETEPLAPSSPLLKREDVLLTPHTGGLSDEGQELLRRTVARAMADVLRGSWPAGGELNNPAIKTMAKARWRA